jgi:leucyl/phenylalanyl-tRNA--protein transferase
MKPKTENTESQIIDPAMLLRAYREGYFPMAESSKPDAGIHFYTARQRGIIPVDAFHISGRSLRYFRKYRFEPRLNSSFADVVDGCSDRDSTWINPVIRDTYLWLHHQGYAHSVEVWKSGKLVGGLYGVAIGAALFAESVFQYHDEAHKAAIYYCWRNLKHSGFELWDVQFHTPHLEQFGCVEIPAKKYSGLLRSAVSRECTFEQDPNL